MKKTILFLSVFVNICILTSATGNRIESRENNPIDLKGNLPKTGTRSPVSSISAFQYADYIEVNLAESLGEITIRIYDEANSIVYDETADSSIQPVIYIDTVLLEAGTYSILFTNSQGQYLSGNFVIE